jgi:hypothetical protein
MAHATKIATCCYCGKRAALVLGKGRHELVCSSCGAPLHVMKRLPSDKVSKPEGTRSPSARTPVRKEAYDRKPEKRKYKSKKRRKSFVRYLFEEAIDVIEDVFD